MPRSRPDRSGPVGPARVLALTYAFFVLAAGARSGVQIATRFSVAPLAYVLSAVAAAVYTAGLVTFLAVERAPGRAIWAVRVCAVELGGVLAIGLVSEVAPGAFPDATVWSGFGSGYGYVPFVLPVLGLAWAGHQQRRRTQQRDRHRDRSRRRAPLSAGGAASPGGRPPPDRASAGPADGAGDRPAPGPRPTLHR